VAPPSDRDRVELDRAEPSEDLEDGVPTSFHRPSRREEMPGDEEPTGCLGCDLHGADASAQAERPAGPSFLRALTDRTIPAPRLA
jgi:hypothetical protein